jgi:hypothetical protein
MKAMVYQKYGPPEVLQLGTSQPLSRRKRTLVESGDHCRRRRAHADTRPVRRSDFWSVEPARHDPGSNWPVRLWVGRARFREGDQVFAFTDSSLAYAQYRSLPETGTVKRGCGNETANMTYAESAAVCGIGTGLPTKSPAGTRTRLRGFRKCGDICSTGQVLCVEVTGVCNSPNVTWCGHWADRS